MFQLLTISPPVTTFCHLLCFLLIFFGTEPILKTIWTQIIWLPWQIRLLPMEQSIGSSLIRVHNVCLYDKILSEVHLNICSRCKKQIVIFQDKNSGGIRINFISHPSDDQIIPKIKSTSLLGYHNSKSMYICHWPGVFRLYSKTYVKWRLKKDKTKILMTMVA